MKPKTDADVDLAGHAYWDDVWQHTGKHRVGHLSFFHHALARVFDRYATAGSRVCEVGCADSAWIPYFLERGCHVTGIDYSEKGVDRLRAVLAQGGLEADLIVADVLDPGFHPDPSHDLVFSMGLIEHFREPSSILLPLRGLLRDGGFIVTVMPNLRGLWGRIQRRLDADVLAVHIPYGPDEVDRIHSQAGFVAVEAAEYFATFGPLVMNAPRLAKRYPRGYRVGTGAIWLIQQAIAWPLGTALGRYSESRALSSHIVGVYKKISTPAS